MGFLWETFDRVVGAMRPGVTLGELIDVGERSGKLPETACGPDWACTGAAPAMTVRCSLRSVPNPLKCAPSSSKRGAASTSSRPPNSTDAIITAAGAIASSSPRPEPNGSERANASCRCSQGGHRRTQALWRKIGAPATALAAVSTLIGAGPSGDPFTIDAILPLTGASAFAGQIHANALRMYELAANATGGIHGRPVHFEIHDDQSNSVTAVELTNQILARKPPVIIGSAYVAACAAEIPLVTNAGALEFCVSPGMTSRQRNGECASAIAITSIVPGEVKVFLAIEVTPASLSFQRPTPPVRQPTTSSAPRWHGPENKSVAIVAFEHFNPSDLSVNALASRIKAANPQGIVLDGVTGNAFGNVLRTPSTMRASTFPLSAAPPT